MAQNTSKTDMQTSVKIDMDTAFEAKTESNKQDLNKILPRLAKRISSTNSPSAFASASTENDSSMKMDSIDEILQTTPTRRPTRSGSIFFKPAETLDPETENLRTKDIQPDANSAADRALSAAAAAGTANSHSATRESNRYDKNSFAIDRTKSKVEGREIQQDHAQYALTYGMMLGIRVTTGRAAFYNMERNYQMKHHLAKGSAATHEADDGEERELTQEDFDYALELAFPPEGTFNAVCPTPPHKLKFTFKFKDYMSNAFRAVRSLSGIDEADYMMSLAGDFNYIEFIANSKSGQFFFYSHDGKYMIKTQTQEESVLLRQIMPQYVAHLNKHPDSLLVRFYGMHRVKMKSLRSKIHFVIMSSVFDTEKVIQVKYDLKGSTIGRLTDPAACANGAVQKDLNLMNSGRKLRFGPHNVQLFHDTLQADCMFLRDLNIMDYSLLVGIHERGSGTSARRRSSVILSKSTSISEAIHHPHDANHSPLRHDNISIFTSYHGGIASSRSANCIYFVGIIDILQLYNTGKKLETFFKGFTNDRRQLSSVDPASYASRMMEFVMRHTDYNERLLTQPSGGGGGANNNNAQSSADEGDESDTSHDPRRRRGSGQDSANSSDAENYSDGDVNSGANTRNNRNNNLSSLDSTPVKLTAQQIALQKLEGRRPPERTNSSVQPFSPQSNNNNNNKSNNNMTPPRLNTSQKTQSQQQINTPTTPQRNNNNNNINNASAGLTTPPPQRSASVSYAPTNNSNGSNKNNNMQNGAYGNGNANGNMSPNRGILKQNNNPSSPKSPSVATASTSSKMNNGSAKGINTEAFAQNNKDKRRNLV